MAALCVEMLMNSELDLCYLRIACKKLIGARISRTDDIVVHAALGLEVARTGGISTACPEVHYHVQVITSLGEDTSPVEMTIRRTTNNTRH